MTTEQTNETPDLIKDLFPECIIPEGPRPEPAAETFDLDKQQMKAISDFRWTLKEVAGVTIDRVRYLTNGHILISSMAIAGSDAWRDVFSKIFAAMGDSWNLPDQFSDQVEKFSPTQESLDFMRKAIESWEEGSNGLELLLTCGATSLLKNSAGMLIGVDMNYLEFTSDWNLSLDDVKGPEEPIPLTHCDSAAFAGILMPLQITDEYRDKAVAICRETIDLLEAGRLKIDG